MRNKELINLRNKTIKERFFELRKNQKNRHLIYKKLELEFWLTKRTIEDIIYSKKQQVIFKDEKT